MAEKPTTKKRAKRARKSKPADPTSSAPAVEAKEESSEDAAPTAEEPAKPENKLLPRVEAVQLSGVQFKNPVRVPGLRQTNGVFGSANTNRLTIFEIRNTPVGPTVFIQHAKGKQAKEPPVKVPMENVSYWV